MACRKSGILTGLPDAYGRGRIIGDYRRVALYGIDYLMKDKFAQFTSLQAQFEAGEELSNVIQLREEIAEQHRALGQMKKMAAKYGCDISRQRPLHRSNSMDLLRLLSRSEKPKRRGDVIRPYLFIPRHLY